MAYEPAHGGAANLALQGAYVPPPGGSVPLDLGGLAPPPGVFRARRVLWVGAGWQAAAVATRAEPAARWTDPPGHAPERALGWGDGTEVRAEPGSLWRDAPRCREETRLPWADTDAKLAAEHAGPWRDPPRRREERRLPWADTDAKLAFELAAAHHDPPRRRDERRLPWGGYRSVPREWAAWYRYPARHRPEWRIPWNQFRLVRWEERWWKEGEHALAWLEAGAPEPVWIPPSGDAVLLPLICPLLDWPGYAVWLFLRERPCAPSHRRRVWRLVNQISVVRLPDRHPVPVLGLSLAGDLESWAWGVRLTLPDRDALALVSPVGGAPVEIEATVNGYTWTALVEGFEERRGFGKSGFVVAGRSRSAVLAAPYAPVRSFQLGETRTAVQLAEAELALVAGGWTLDWDTVDWLVPAGAWSYHDLTPLQALARVAGAVGAGVQSDRELKAVRVLPRYPVSPWAWAAADPDTTLLDALVPSLALRWEERPGWQGVYVSGEAQGALVRVRRTGTDGMPNHPLVVDALTTHVDAGRERGRQVLARAGKWATVTVELPILPIPQEPGLLTPGQLVEVADGVATWKALVVSCRVEAGRPRVRQTVDLERYYGP
ncbi:MAG: hypothetical protein AB1578_07080 [Thermodesulfobacteriota bacterium]